LIAGQARKVLDTQTPQMTAGDAPMLLGVFEPGWGNRSGVPLL